MGSGDIKADLHIHSVHSDGVNTLDEIIDMAKDRKLDMIAITDHDNVDVINDINLDNDLKVIVGTEFSTIHNKENVHLLAYYKNNKPNDNVQKLLKGLEVSRVSRAKKMLYNLEKYYGFKLDLDELLKISEGSVGRPAMARLLLKHYNISREEAFLKYLGNDSPCYIPSSNLELKDVIDFLHKNDAICVLAHPILYKKTDVLDFIKLGIDGIECHYPQHDYSYRKKLVSLANKHNLLITGGSDFHDKRLYKDNGHGCIGDAYIEEDNINELLVRLEVKCKKL